MGLTPFASEYQPAQSRRGNFALALTVCEILIFLSFYLENLGQGHGREKRDLRHKGHFCANSYRFRCIFTF